MSLDFILIPCCIFIIIFLLNRENKIYKKNQKAKQFNAYTELINFSLEQFNLLFMKTIK